MNAQICPECGMEKDAWPNKTGVTKSGKTYCCQGCANGTGCTCPTTASSKPTSRQTAKKM